MGGSEENSKAQTEEIQKWNGFAKVLRTEDKLAFDEVMNTYQRIASGNSDGTDLAPFEQLALSVTVGQMAKLSELERRLDVVEPPKPEPEPEQKKPRPKEPIPYHKLAPKKAQRSIGYFGWQKTNYEPKL